MILCVQALHTLLTQAGVTSELKYCGSSEALASLHNGTCDAAGFHAPLGEFEAETVAQFLDVSLGSGLSEHRLRWVAGDQVDEREDQRRDAE